MEFYISKNATLPLLKLQIVKDGRVGYDTFNQLIEKSAIYFSMVDTKTGRVKTNLSQGGFVSKIFDDPNTPTEYYIYYRFSKKDTNKIGRFEGQFLLKNDEGTLILPIRESLFINILDSNISDIDQEINEISLNASYSPGSILSIYTLSLKFPIPSDLTFSFQNILGTIEGTPIVIDETIVIPAKQTSSFISVTTDSDYFNLNKTSEFNNITYSFNYSTNFKYIVETSFVFSNVINTPTPTPTETTLVSPTPTETPTSTITPTPTETTLVSPTPTETPTPTITPTPTQQPEQTILDAILTVQDIGYIDVGDGFYLKYVDPINLIDPILTDDNDFITVGENLFLKYINPSPVPSSSPTPTPTPTITPTPSPIYYYYFLLDCDNTNNKIGRSIVGGLTGIYNVDIDKCYLIVGSDLGPYYDYDLDTSTLVVNCNDILCIQPSPTPTPSITQTYTPTQSPAVFVPLTLYIQIISGGESIIFDGVTYTADTEVSIIKNQSYNIEAVPSPGYIFVGWNIYGGSFSSTAQTTTVSVSLDSGANLAPSYSEDPNYDALEAQLSSNLVNYQNATDNNWVSITQEEYNNIFNNVDAVIKIGNSDEQVNTRAVATGYDTTTFGTVDANTPLTIPTGYYVVGFVAESWNQNGQVELGYTTTYHTGTPTYMGNSPNVIGGMTMFYVRKRPGNVEGAPASTNLYPVLNFVPPAYPNAVPNTFGWFTLDGGTNWSETVSSSQTAKIQILLTNTRSWPLPPLPSPTPTNTPTTTITPTPSLTPNCVRQIVVPSLYNGVTNINSNQLQLTQTSETLQIRVNDIITDNIGSTSFVGIVSSDGTYTYVFTGPGGGVAFDCQFPLTFSGSC